MKPHNIRKSRGVTLTEVMITIAIVGILAAIAVPSYRNMTERTRLKQAAESLADDLKFARTEAIKHSCNVTLTFASPGYNIKTVINGVACTASTTLKTVDTSQFTGVSFSNTDNVTFSSLRGTTTEDETLSSTLSTSNYSLSVNAETSGRIRICSTNTSLGYTCN